MHPSQTLVPRLSALIGRAARRQPARLIPPAAVVAVQVSCRPVLSKPRKWAHLPSPPLLLPRSPRSPACCVMLL
jgi:hypothetical protein